MSLPKYNSWKNKKLYVEMQVGTGSPQLYIPSTEKNMVGNQLRSPEPVHQPETSRNHSTAPSMQSGGPVRSDTDGWYEDILSKFRQNMKKLDSPKNNISLGDMGMKSIGDSTFEKQPGATEPGGTPLVSSGIPVTDMKGQFD